MLVASGLCPADLAFRTSTSARGESSSTRIRLAPNNQPQELKSATRILSSARSAVLSCDAVSWHGVPDIKIAI